ncbi:hypothetical protein Q5424_12940 [Conexibacter sp. JD483]|uniref:hypothetical protein n=1 Tax=unclassified Conexibacter TaxID=2627773 RepID=UPI00271955F0|nr:MULTISPECIES: hypothetical protein [unclassified Conexibacter]MDO8187335.1 hypothetical protein [Conexibacter sp. CPCC 205706]MDO8200532.1 hypothetical protein [Conexibacter sp. CPCC 205762]MDR9369999.1 hypothetical protein [Conexibacter sp. JD483]
MPRTSLLAAAAALLLALPATAIAADPLPVGKAQGVRVTGARTGVVFHFGPGAASLRREVAGRRVAVSCTALPRDEDKLGVVPGGSSGGTYVRVARRRAPLRTGMVEPTADYCSLGLPGKSPLVSVPLTQAGAIVLDEREKASMLLSLQLIAGTIGDRVTPSAYPTPARFVASREARSLTAGGYPIVALAAPTDTPQGRRAFGYWSDGGRSAAFVTLSASGRRLYLQVGPDAALSTNIAGAIFGAED